MTPENAPPQNKPAGIADHLSNERTFLAWIRTSIALMGFGFVIVKFALFLRQLSVALDAQMLHRSKGYSAVIGVTMVALGAVMAVGSYFRYLKVEKQLNSGSYKPSKWMLTLMALSIVTGAVMLVLYLLPNI